MPISELDPWQRLEDGFPSDAYFEAVASALRAAGVHLNDWIREEDWEVNYELADDVIAASRLAWAGHGLYVSWRCDQDDEPLTGGFTGLGWYWVPYSKPQAGGDFAKEFAINELAEPADVAAAVRALLHPDAARTPAPLAGQRQHAWVDCGHRADFASAAEHDRDCPALPDTRPYQEKPAGGEDRG